MLNFLLNRNNLIDSDNFIFYLSLDEISQKIILKSSSPFFYTYLDDSKMISINFRIIDIGISYKVTVYKNTNYTKTMSEADIESYLKRIVFPSCENEVDKLFSNFTRTMTTASPLPTGIHYNDIYDIGYCFSGEKKKKFLTGKTSLVNKKNNLTIEHQTWMRDNYELWNKSTGFRFIIINEFDSEIKKMKSSIVKYFYKKLYDRYTN